MYALQKATQVTLDTKDLIAAYAYPDNVTGAKRPRAWVRGNMISSVDGAAAVRGTSGALGGDGDHDVFRVLRGLADAVLVGSGTVIAEDYGPTKKSKKFTKHRAAAGQEPIPLLAILSSSLHLPLDHPAVIAPTTVILTCRSAPVQPRNALTAAGATLVDCGESTVELPRALDHLASIGRPRVLCEGGPTLLGRLIDENLLDELCLTVSPALVGGDGGRITTSSTEGALHGMRRAHVLADDDGYLFTRWVRRQN
ncbi:pyrimidine reductase family protein [Gordonia jinhuaensis]|nr:pyrimidine reductase family protein [Gordonia jinhuaensis]